MKRAILAVVITGCGGKPAATAAPIEQTSTAGPRADMVLVELGEGIFSALVCAHDPCAAPADGTALRDGRGARWTVADTNEQDCDYGIPMIVVRAMTTPRQPDDDQRHDYQLAVIPADAEIGFRGLTDAALDADTAAAIARLASAELGGTVPAEDIGADAIVADVDGDGTEDRVYAADAETDDSDDEGAYWHGLVYLRHGDPASAVAFEQSHREDDELALIGSFDLEGDGAREVYFRFADDDGEQLGVITWPRGEPTIDTWLGIC